MSKLTKTLVLPQPELIKNVDKGLLNYLRQLTDALHLEHRHIWDFAESGGASTPNWNVREATAADVTAGEAVAVGNLIIEHKTNLTRREFEA